MAARCMFVVLAVLAAGQFVHAADWPSASAAARRAEDSLAFLTTLFAGGSPAATGDLAQLAAQRFGGNFINLGSSGRLGVNLRALDGAAATAAASSSDGADLAFNVSGLLASFPPATAEALIASSSLFVNELATPGARLVERAQQLGQIATAVVSGSEACGTFSFTPGGAAVRAKWTGPIFSLVQTSGNCVLQPALQGEGNTRWTRLQETLACLGPSTQWAWEPLKYAGVSRERTVLDGPECKIEYKAGPELSVTLYGGDSKGKITFATEKEFYAAMLVNKTFDFQTQEFRALLSSVQLRVDDTVVQLGGLLHAATANNSSLKQVEDKMQASPVQAAQLADAFGQKLRKGMGRSLFPKRKE